MSSPSSSAAAASTSAAETTASSAAATSATPSAAAKPAGTLVEVVFSGDNVETENPVVRIKKGSTVTVRVTSDIDDEIHVHGYDLTKKVPANGTAEITFKADQAGTWEVELEDEHVELVKLRVQ